MDQFINEIWKPISVNPNYLISNYGRVKTIDHPVWSVVNNSFSIRKGILCTLSNNNSKKYWRVGIQINNKRKSFAIHRLVATAFIPNPNNLPQINHKDGNKDNNHVSNLEWCTNSYNQKHAIEKGLKSKATMSRNCHLRKLTEEQVAFIRDIYSKTTFSKLGDLKYFCIEMAELFNLKSTNTIKWIIENRTNKFVNQNIVQTTNYNKWLEKYNKIHEQVQQSRPKLLKDYAEELGVPAGTFHSRYRALGKNLNATINFYKEKYHLNK